MKRVTYHGVDAETYVRTANANGDHCAVPAEKEPRHRSEAAAVLGHRGEGEVESSPQPWGQAQAERPQQEMNVTLSSSDVWTPAQLRKTQHGPKIDVVC